MLNQFSLAGRTAIVTGSGRNIGRAIAKLFAEAGANVVINGHSDKKAVDSVVAEIVEKGGKAIGVMADVAKPDEVVKMVEEGRKVFGAIDIAVSNVSIRPKKPFLDVSIEEWHNVFNTNLHSAFYMARAVIPGMRGRGWGRLIHITGLDGFATQLPERIANSTAKNAQHTMAKLLAVEFGPFGITANSVAPGYTDTERDWSNYDRNVVDQEIANTPLRRVGKVEDIANACLYLASDAGGFVSGQVIHVNGGAYRF